MVKVKEQGNEVVSSFVDSESTLPNQVMLEDEATENVESSEAETEEPEKVSKKDSEEVQEEQAEAYVPQNLKYKVYDEELEFPDFLKAVIDSRDREDELRTMLSKSGAFDTLKSKYEERGERLQDVATNYQKVVERISELNHYADNDLTTFFKQAGIPERKIVEWVRDYIKEQELPEHERSLRNQWRQSIQQNWQNQRQNETYQEQLYSLAKEKHEMEYQRLTSLPDISSFQQAFDSKLGKGAFREHADNYGQMYYQQNGHDTSWLDAIQHVMTKYKSFIDVSSPDQNTQVDPVKARIKEREESKPKGFIPNVGKSSGDSSPVTKRFKNLDDLKRHVANRLG